MFDTCTTKQAEGVWALHAHIFVLEHIKKHHVKNCVKAWPRDEMVV